MDEKTRLQKNISLTLNGGHDYSFLFKGGENRCILNNGNRQTVSNVVCRSDVENNFHDNVDTNGPVSKGEVSESTTVQGRVNSEQEFQFSELLCKRRCLITLCTIASFLASCSVSMIGPFYTVKAKSKGMPLSVTGLVYGAYQCTVFTTAPIFGVYLTNIGPKFVYTSGIFIGGSCNILFGFLDKSPNGTPFIVLSFACRILEGLGFSAFQTASFSILSTEFPDNAALVLGIMEAGSGLGFMLGPTIGSLLNQLGGYGLPFFVAGSAMLANGIIVFKFLPSTNRTRTHLSCKTNKVNQQKHKSVSQLCILRNKLATCALLSTSIGTIGIFGFEATFSIHLEKFELSTLEIGLLYGLAALSYSLLSPLWGFLADRKPFSTPLILVCGHVVFASGFILIGPTYVIAEIISHKSLWCVCLGTALIGAAFGSTLSPATKCMMQGILEIGYENDLQTYGAVIGLFNAFHNLGGFLGPIMVTGIGQVHGLPVAYTVVGAISIAMALIISVCFLCNKIIKKYVTN